MAVAEIMLDLLLSVFVDLFLIGTGELLLCAFTLGKRKPTFRFWRKDPSARMPDRLGFSMLLGLVFWVLIWMLLRV